MQRVRNIRAALSNIPSLSSLQSFYNAYTHIFTPHQRERVQSAESQSTGQLEERTVRHESSTSADGKTRKIPVINLSQNSANNADTRVLVERKSVDTKARQSLRPNVRPLTRVPYSICAISHRLTVNTATSDRAQRKCIRVFDMPEIVELNVGGVHYTTTLATLLQDKTTLLHELFAAAEGRESLAKDSKGRYFLDRDGVLFRYILDFLRDKALNLPEGFRERQRLQREAEHFKLTAMLDCIRGDRDAKPPGCITIGYRGSFQFGKDGLADVKFRKLSRILVCGRVAQCREVFGDTLNESRDPDHGGPDRYTSRFFLKHCFIEQAFDNLHEHGYRMAGSCGSGTAGSAGDPKPGVDTEENRWNHYNEFVFIRD